MATTKVNKYPKTDSEITLVKEQAEAGNADAQNVLGVLFYEGDGVKKDHAQAFEWLFRAAEQGHAKGMFNVGLLYSYGYGVPKNDEKAVEYYMSAAEKGVRGSYQKLGNAYYYGKGTEKDMGKALEWYEKAVEAGLDESQPFLAWAYSERYGVSKDEEKAKKWLFAAVEKGNLRAKLLLASFYHDERLGLKRDEEEIAKIIREVTDSDDSNAKIMLGSMYVQGDTVSHDYEKAFQCIRSAIKQNNADAAYQYAYHHAFGLGTEQDFIKAYAYALLAQDIPFDHERAEKLVRTIQLGMTTEQKREGRRKMKELKKRLGLSTTFSQSPISGRIMDTNPDLQDRSISYG